jgi:hypothetical protein
VRVAVLVAVPVDLEPHIERVRISDLIPGHKPRADGPERVVALALIPGATALDLIVTLGDVVDEVVAEDGALGLFRLTWRAISPMTMPNSTSQSGFSDPGGRSD